MNQLNHLGIDTSSLNNNELIVEIKNIGDFMLVCDCIETLFQRNRNTCLSLLETLITTDQSSSYYGDKFYQTLFLNYLIEEDSELAVQYISDNFQQFDPYVFVGIVNSLLNKKYSIFSETAVDMQEYITNKGMDFFDMTDEEKIKDILSEFLEIEF